MPSVMQHCGTPNRRHNRDLKYRAQLENVDASLSKYNEILRSKSVDEIYAEHLQPAFEEFNDNQIRKDRRYDVKWNCSTYLEYQRIMDKRARASSNAIDQKGRPPIRELVWQIGNPEQGYGCLDQTDESRTKIKEMLLECQEIAEQRYKNLAWGDLDFHADEVSYDADGKVCGSLHLHSSFVPLCSQNKQGPKVQVALERSLKEMGFDSFEAWKHDLDDIMETVLERHGLKRVVMDNHNTHQESTEFHRQQRLIRQTKELTRETERLGNQAMLIESHINTATQQVEKQIEDAVATAVENVLSNNTGVYDNIFFLVENCSEERLDELDQEGADLKKQLLPNAIDVSLVQRDLSVAIDIAEENKKDMSWQERQKLFGQVKGISSAFWEIRAELKEGYDAQISEEYQKRGKALKSYYDAQYILRRTHNIFIALGAFAWASISLSRKNAIDEKIGELKKERKMLVSNTATFKKYNNAYIEDIKAGKEPADKYMQSMEDVVRELEEAAAEFKDKNFTRHQPSKNNQAQDSQNSSNFNDKDKDRVNVPEDR